VRVIQVLASSEDGGLEKHFIELCNSLSSKVELIAIADKRFKKSIDKRVNFISFDFSPSRNNPFMLFRILKILKNQKADIIHCQANKATSIVTKLKPFLDSKIIGSLHSQKRNVKAFDKCDFAITVSKRISKNIKNPNKRVIYNGLNIESIKRSNYLKEQFNLDGFIFVSIGRLEVVKGYEWLIESFKNIDAKLLIIGQGSQESKLKELIKRLKLEQNIVIETDYRDDIYKILANSNCSIISSEREGFSYVFLESLLLNTPLLSTDVADIKEFIGDKYIIDSENITDKLNYAIENQNSMQSDFKESFKNAKENLTFNSMIEQTISLYKEIL